MALVVKSTSYVAIGWRPKSLTPACKNFPLIQAPGTTSKAQVNQKTEPEPTSKAEPTPEPESEPEPKSEPEPTTEPNSEPEPTSEPEPSPKKSLYSRRSTYNVQKADDDPEDIIETSVSYKVTLKQGLWSIRFVCVCN